MDNQNPNRLNALSSVPSIERQTPNNDFGSVIARTTAEVVNRGVGVLSPVISSVPVLSAAVYGSQSVLSGALSASGSQRILPLPASSSQSIDAQVSAGRGEQWELLDAQRAMQREGATLNAQYLEMQNALQRESREFNAMTNILKVRHDSAKAAINNIR